MLVDEVNATTSYQEIKSTDTITLYTITQDVESGEIMATSSTNEDGFSLSDTFFSKITGGIAYSAIAASGVYVISVILLSVQKDGGTHITCRLDGADNRICALSGAHG